MNDLVDSKGPVHPASVVSTDEPVEETPEKSGRVPDHTENLNNSGVSTCSLPGAGSKAPKRDMDLKSRELPMTAPSERDDIASKQATLDAERTEPKHAWL